MGFPILRPPKFGAVRLLGLISVIGLDLQVLAKGLEDMITAMPGETTLNKLQG